MGWREPERLLRLNSSLEKKIAAGFAVALVVLLLVFAVAGWNAHRFDQTLREVDETHRVLNELEQVLVGILSMQTTSRGFVLTGSEEMLRPFEQHEPRLNAAVAALQPLAANPIQREKLQALRPALDHAIAIMHERIESRRERGLEASRESAAFLRGEAAVSQVRGLVRQLQEEERRLLAEGARTTSAAARSTIEAALVGCALAVAFLLSSGLLARRDFRQRRRAEDALQKSQRMFQRLFDNAPDAIIQVDRSGLIVRANKQAEVLFGWSTGELTGQRIEQLLPQRFHARHGGHLTAYFAAPRTRAMGAGLELFGRRRDDTEFPLDIMLSPLDTDEGLQALAVIRDVSERKAADDKVRRLNLDLQLQNARLEIANKELESFSYSVSHDLRAPLRHIDGFANLLAKHADATLDDQSRRFLTVISDSARRMGRLIDDLLTFSRMARTHLELSRVDNNLLVAAVIREGGFDREAIEWAIAPVPEVRADAAMLRQVWFNLIENAVKYSVRVSPRRIEIGTIAGATQDNEVIFFVRDNGVGFDMKYAAKLFGVFQRLHSEAEFEGTGIGLANVRRIITRHGGRTWGESSLGSGATFFFSLPAKTP